MAHVLQYHVFSGTPLTNAACTVQIFNSDDGTPATLWNDREESDPVGSHEFEVQSGFFCVYAGPGYYDIRAFDLLTGEEQWFRDVEIGGWLI